MVFSNREFTSKDVHLYIFYGQSLSVGGGSKRIEFPPGTIDKRILTIKSSVAYDVRLGLASRLDGNPPLVPPLAPSSLGPFSRCQPVFTNFHYGLTPAESFGTRILRRFTDDRRPPPTVALIATGVGGAAWKYLRPGTIAYQNTLIAVKHAVDLCKSSGRILTVPGIVFVHGESDAANPYYEQETVQNLIEMRSDVKKLTGQADSAHCFLTQPSSHKQATGGKSAVAIEKIHGRDGIFFMVTPTYHLPFGNDYQHLSSHGYYYLGEHIAESIYSQLYSKNHLSSYFRLQNIEVTEKSVRINLTDAAVLHGSDRTYGFQIDAAGAGAGAQIAEVHAEGRQLIILLHEPLTSPAVVRYALKGHGDDTPRAATAPNGGVRSSHFFKSLLDGKELHSWLPHFERSI